MWVANQRSEKCRRLRRFGRPNLIGGLLVLTLCGCGTSQYERGLNQRVELTKRNAPYLDLYDAATDIPGTNLAIRFPKLFKTVVNDPAKQPPFIQLPGFKFGYEEKIRDPNNNLFPFSCFVGAKGLQPAERPLFENDLLEAVKATFPDAAWQAVDAATPEGGTLAWKKISVRGDQSFLVENFGTFADRRLPGIFELWLHEGEAGNVVLAWRVPQSVERSTPISSLAQAAAGTLVVKQAPAAPAAQ